MVWWESKDGEMELVKLGFLKGSLFSLVLFGFPLKFICNVNEKVKHSSVQLVAVMHLLGGLPTANKHKEEEDIVDRSAPNATRNHCFLHQEALAAKDMVPVLDETSNDVIKVVNHMKWGAKNSR